jgi:hypothetical protein
LVNPGVVVVGAVAGVVGVVGVAVPFGVAAVGVVVVGVVDAPLEPVGAGRFG